jgi:IclR family KDG regulon transcriptional repressor
VPERSSACQGPSRLDPAGGSVPESHFPMTGTSEIADAADAGRDDAELRSAGRALDILSCFTLQHSEWGVTDLALHLGFSKSVVHRLLRTLISYGFVDQLPSKRYCLGPKTLELGNTYRFSRRFLVRSEPYLRQLAVDTRCVAHLAQLDGRETIELLRASGPGAVMFSPYPIQRQVAHATALGKVLLAAGGEECIRRFLGRRVKLAWFTPRTITSPVLFRVELERVAQNGYAVSDEESRPGCRCYAVPVYDNLGRTVVALSVSGPTQSFDPERELAVLQRLKATAHAISPWL